MSRNIMTLNLHCLVEDHLPDKQQRIATTVAQLNVDVLFLQEVAQTATNPIVYGTVKTDNYAYVLQQKLAQIGLQYHLYFIPIKASFP